MAWTVRLTTLLLVLIVGLTTVQAQPVPQEWNWRNVTPIQGSAPAPRRNGSAIYDPAGHRLIVFGGTTASGPANDVWALDLNRSLWIQLQTSGSAPAPRLGHNAEYDPVGHQMIIWAGQQGSIFFNDTRALDLTQLEWRDLSPVARPRARYGSASVFDSPERRLVQFAGFTEEGNRFQDTQAFSLQNGQWQNLTPAGLKPQIRCLHTAALQRGSRRMIMFGGQRSGPLDDLWAFDLATRVWTELPSAEKPSARFFAASFVDSQGDFYLFGGSTAAGNTNDTWSYSFGRQQWQRLDLPAAPAARNGMMGAYIDTDRYVVFGGTGAALYNDVWELRRAESAPAAQAHFAQFANGEGWSSAFVLTNPSATTVAAGSLSYFDDQGRPHLISTGGQTPAASTPFVIQPLGNVTISTNGIGPLLAGWARVSCNVPVSGVIKFTAPGLGITGVGASAALSRFIVPVTRSVAGGSSTGLAVAAVAAPVTLNMSLRNRDGEPIAGAQISVDLPSGGHLSRFVEELFGAADTSEFDGTLVVSVAGGDVVATAIQLGRRPGDFTTLPVAALRQ
ncbi:MAG: Kelch repeat-containing protein [Acidobacteriota bacterium]